MTAKEEFIQIYNQNIKREGADKLLQWLESTDFFNCPASTRFHNNFEGGLVDHSVKVYHRLKKIVADEKMNVSNESIAIIALLHDVCKANIYKIDYRNVKRDGEWVKEPYFTVDDALPYGHGEKSVYIINGFLRLTREEAMAINKNITISKIEALIGHQGKSNDMTRLYTHFKITDFEDVVRIQEELLESFKAKKAA